MLSAEIIAIGSELLTPRFKDTNSLYLTEQLNAVGIPVVMKTIVGDDEHYLEDAIRHSLARTPILITIGGLGPTEDDVTRKVVGRVLQQKGRGTDLPRLVATIEKCRMIRREPYVLAHPFVPLVRDRTRWG